MEGAVTGQLDYRDRLVDCLLADEEGRQFMRRMLSPRVISPEFERKSHGSKKTEGKKRPVLRQLAGSVLQRCIGQA
jgi:hypothetical protein